jgi:thiol-disulfide isomerase/thioredoxin
VRTRRLSITAFGAFLLLASTVPATFARGAKVGRPAPEFTHLDVAGNEHRLSAHDGEVRLVYFWATWCAPCAKVGPVVQGLHEHFGDDGLRTYGVHYNDAGDPAAYATDAGYTFTILPEANEIAKRYRVSKIPTVVIVDRDGTVLFREKGTDPAMLERLRETVAAAVERHE